MSNLFVPNIYIKTTFKPKRTFNILLAWQNEEPDTPCPHKAKK